MKVENNQPKKDSCSLCEGANKALENSGKKKDKKSSFWNRKILLLTGVLFFGILSIAISAAVVKTKEPSALTDQSVEIVRGTQAEGPQIDSLAPDFTAEDVNGQKLSLSDFRGQKPVLLVFWATWCGVCAQELEGLKTFTQKHQDEIQVVVVDSGEPKDTIRDYIRQKNVNFMMLLDEQKKIWNQYLVRGTPSHFLIDKEGVIVTLQPGLASLDNLETMLKMVSK